MLLQHAYNKKFIQHEKYNIRWAFRAQVQRHYAVPRVKVQKGTTKIGEASSLIMYMHILGYISIRTNQNIVISTIPERVPHAEILTCNSKIPERVPHTEKYNTKFHNTRWCSTHGKYITQNSIIPEQEIVYSTRE